MFSKQGELACAEHRIVRVRSVPKLIVTLIAPVVVPAGSSPISPKLLDGFDLMATVAFMCQHPVPLPSRFIGENILWGFQFR